MPIVRPGLVTPGLSDEDYKKYYMDDTTSRSLSYYDKDGNYIGGGSESIRVNPGDINKVYKKDDGTYTTTVPEAKVEIDRITGDITVTAPDYVINRDGFKEQTSSLLETLSRYYKADPDYKIPMQDGSTKTVDQILADLNDPNNSESIVSYARSVDNMLKQENGYRDSSGHERKGDRIDYGIKDNVELKDSYFMWRNMIALGDGAKDDTRQAIPKELAEAEFLRRLESYDEETSSVSLKNLMEEGWNREKHSDDELKELNSALERYFANSDQSDMDEYARCIALYEFINGRAPDVAWMRNVVETVGQAFGGALTFTTDLGVYVIGGTSAAIFGSVEDATDDLAHYIFNTEDNDSSDIKAWFNEFSDIWEEEWKGERQADLELLSDTQAAANNLGYSMAKLATLISAGNVLSSAAQLAASSIADSASLAAAMSAEGIVGGADAITNGFSIIMSWCNPAAVASIANTVSVLMSEAGALSTIAGLVGESFAEAITGNPRQFYEVLNSGELTPQAKQDLWEEFLGNALGYGVGMTAVKGLKTVGETLKGRAVSHNISKVLNSIAVKVGNIKDSVRMKIHGVDDISDYVKKLYDSDHIRKADAVSMNQMLRKAQEEVANSDFIQISGKTQKEIAEQLDEVEEAVFKLRRMNNAIDNMRSGGKGIAAEWYLSGKYKDFEGANKALEDSYEVIRKLEKTTKMRGTRPGKLAVTQDTANYLGGKIRADIIQSILKANPNGKNVKAMKEELEFLQDMISKFEDDASPELIAACSRFTDDYRKWATEANNLLIDEGLLNKQLVEELRSSGLWGENGELYAPLYREKHLDSMHKLKVNVINKDTALDPYHYTFGSQDDFLDPLAASRMYMRRYADVASRQQVVKAYTSLSGAQSNVVLDFAQTEAARLAEKGITGARNAEMSATVKDMAKEIRASGLAKKFELKTQAKYAFNKGERAMNAAESAVERVKSGESVVKMTSGKYSRAAYSMTEGEITDIWNANFGAESAAAGGDFIPANTKTYVLTNYQSLPKATKSMIQEKVGEVNFLKGNSLLENGTELDVAEIIRKRTGANNLSDALDNMDSNGASAKEKRELLRNLFGRQRGDEIWKSATEYANGAQDTAKAFTPEDVIRQPELDEAGFRELQEKAKAERELSEEVKRVKELRANPELVKSKADVSLMKKWMGKDTPDVSNEARLALLRAETAKDSMQEARKAAEVEAEAAKKAKKIADMRSGALSADNAKELADDMAKVKRWSGKLSKADKSLLEKWDGLITEDDLTNFKKMVGKPVEDVSTDARKAYQDLLDQKNTMRGTSLVESQVPQSGDAEELKVVKTRKEPTTGDIKQALAYYDYGGGDISNDILENYADIQSVRKITYNNGEVWDEIVDYDPEFEGMVKRSIIGNTKTLREKPEFAELAYKYAENDEIARRELRLYQRKEQYAELSNVLGKSEAEVDDEISGLVDSYLGKITEKPTIDKTFDKLVEYYGIPEEEGRKFFALRSAHENLNGPSGLRAQLKKQLAAELKEMGWKDADARTRAAGNMAALICDQIDDEYNDMRVFFDTVAPEMVDQPGMYSEVRKLYAEVNKAEKAKDTIVAIQDNDGRVAFVETDPVVASLLNHDTLPRPMNGWQRTNYLLSKMFRLGTTGINITSIVNQTFRDFGNAFVGGNLYRTIGQTHQEIREVLGDNIIGWIERDDAALAKSIRKTAQETGADVNELAVEAIERTGRSVAPTVTETDVYKQAAGVQAEIRGRDFGGGIVGTRERAFRKLSDKINKTEDTLGKANEFRESYLRNAVYQNAFADGVKRGYSYAKCRDFATFAMNNATTNFGRLTEHFSNLQQSVPFLGAAINGTKSFYRLLSVDPVGVMGRLVGGFIVPTIALTAYSLHDEKNVEAWKNLKEYEKDENIIFAVDGKIYSIPIPQELGAFVNPWRTLVEDIYNANRHDFWQLAANNIVGLSPISLEGFVNIDHNVLMDGTTQNNFFVNNIEPGVAKVFSQLAPVWMKAVMMYATKIDPYTMKKIDADRYGVDPDTGESIILNDYSGRLASLVSKVTKGTPFEMSSAMAEKMLGSIFGAAPIDYLGWLIEIGEGIVGVDGTTIGGALEDVGEGLLKKVTSPMYVQQYRSVAEDQWRKAVSQLYVERNELLQSDKWQDYMKQYRNAKTAEELEKLKSVRENLVADYYKDVKTVVDNLIKAYPDSYTAEKYNSVIALSVMMNVGADTTEYGKQELDAVYKDAKRKAIGTMQNMGFTSPKDYSAFGYVRTNSAGETYVAYSTPMSILNIRNSISGAGAMHAANITSVLDANGLTKYGEAYKEMQKQENAIRAKGNLTSDDYDKINMIRKNWDVRVMYALYPYIDQYGIDAVLNDSQVLDILDDIVRVPTDFEVTNKGRFFSSSRLNKQRGFAPAYIEYVYNMIKGEE